MNTVRKLYMIGNAHIDPVWLWRWQEGLSEVKATFRSALDRMNEFPDFVFTCSSAAYYEWIEQNCPEMFEEIRKRVEEGRWVIAGGWWIQPDCNLPSGEAFARQGLISQSYFISRFGKIARTGYNVDSFGHNRGLPQILNQSGLKHYVFMRPDEHEKDLPKNLFWWEGVDGTRVITFRIFYSYNNYLPDEGDLLDKKIRFGIDEADKQKIDIMVFYGVGNHGGGPTIDNINTIINLRKEFGSDNIKFSSPDEYFENIKSRSDDLPVIKDELLHHASGCYSVNGKIKMKNRKAEISLLNAEKLSVLAHSLMKLDYPKNDINKAWKKVLFNQFHDILGGCSIKDAYEDAEEFYGAAITAATEAINNAIQTISWNIDTRNKLQNKDPGVPIVIFNTLPWEVEGFISSGAYSKGIVDDMGFAVSSQKIRAAWTHTDNKWDTLFKYKIPAFGYKVYRMVNDKEYVLPKDSSVLASVDNSEAVLENNFIRMELETYTGHIKRLYDKHSKADILSSNGAVPIVIDDYISDTWAHKITKFNKETGTFADAEIKLLEKGPLRAVLRVINRYNKSILRQDFVMHYNKPDIEVNVRLNWNEHHKLLKLQFPVKVQNPKSVSEIPYGFIERDTDGVEYPTQQWVDVSGKLVENNAPYGLAIINNGSCSYDVNGQNLRITLVRSAVYAEIYEGRDEVCEHTDQGIHELRYSLVPHLGEWNKADIVRKAYEFNTQPLCIREANHEGILPAAYEGIYIQKSNIIATALKMAEAKDGYILRCYEAHGIPTETELELKLADRKWSSGFKGCEIKTFFIPFDPLKAVEELNLIELSTVEMNSIE